MPRSPQSKESYRLDLVRVGIARRFGLDRVDDPELECQRRGVAPQAMIQLALETDVYGRPRDRQRSLPL